MARPVNSPIGAFLWDVTRDFLSAKRTIRERWKIAGAFYLGLLLLGTSAILLRTRACAPDANRQVAGLPAGILDKEKVRWVAARRLPKNHFLSDGDLVPDVRLPRRTDILLPDKKDFAGKWLCYPKAAGDPIEQSDVAGQPDIVAIPGTAVVAATVPTDVTAKLMDAGSSVDLVASSKVVSRAAEVVALECAAGKCSALVRVTNAEAAAVAEAATPPAAVLRAGPLPLPPAAPPQPRRSNMEPLDWKVIREIEVSSNPAGLWTKALDFVPQPAKLKFESDGTWKYSDDARPVGPDGDSGASAPADLLVPGAPIGCVVAKIGGSTAGKADGKTFAVGSYATHVMDKDTSGALFLSINVIPSRFPANGGSIKVKIYEAP